MKAAVLRRNFPVDKMGGASYHVASRPLSLPPLLPSLTELGAQVPADFEGKPLK